MLLFFVRYLLCNEKNIFIVALLVGPFLSQEVAVTLPLPNRAVINKNLEGGSLLRTCKFRPLSCTNRKGKHNIKANFAAAAYRGIY